MTRSNSSGLIVHVTVPEGSSIRATDPDWEPSSCSNTPFVMTKVPSSLNFNRPPVANFGTGMSRSSWNVVGSKTRRSVPDEPTYIVPSGAQPTTEVSRPLDDGSMSGGGGIDVSNAPVATSKILATPSASPANAIWVPLPLRLMLKAVSPTTGVETGWPIILPVEMLNAAI